MFSISEEKKSTKLIVGITCVLFFIICVLSIIIYGNSTLMGSLIKPDNDDVKFIRSAWILAETGNYVYHKPPNPTVFMMPGLPFTLAAFVKVFGKFGGITALRVFHAAAQTISLYMVFLIARKIFNSKVAVAALLINALCIWDYWVANLILTESIFKLFVLLLIYFSIHAIEEKRTSYYVIGGIFWGLAALFRPTIAAFPIIILVLWIKKKYSFKEIVKYTVLVACIFCMILSPWWIRNYNVFHRFIPFTLATGNPMLQGTYLLYDQSSRKTDGLNYHQFKYPAGTEIKNNEVEIAISKYRLKNLVPKQPIQFLLWYTFGKAGYMLMAPFIWTEFLGVHYWMAFSWHYLILIFGIIGIKQYFSNKERNKMGIVLFGSILFFIGVYLPYFAFPRYFYPAIPFVIIFAAYSLTNLIDKKKVKKIRT